MIISTTASKLPLIKTSHPLKKKTHLIGLGADQENKQEIEESLFKNADKIIVDSKKQATTFGDLSKAIHAGTVVMDDVIELGEALEKEKSFFDGTGLMMTDLTGIASQDLALAQWICEKALKEEKK